MRAAATVSIREALTPYQRCRCLAAGAALDRHSDSPIGGQPVARQAFLFIGFCHLELAILPVRGKRNMRTFGFRATLIAMMAMLGACFATVAQADSGTIRLSVLKGGWFIGASGGSGTLTFRGRQLSAVDRRNRRGPGVWGVAEQLVRPGNQHPPAVGCGWRLWGGRRGCGDRRRCAGNCADQRKRRGPATERPSDRLDGECRSQRIGDLTAVRGRRRRASTCAMTPFASKQMAGLRHRVRSGMVLEMLAPRAGFEPATNRLTAGCSTTELPGNNAETQLVSGERITKPPQLAKREMCK